MIEIAYLEPDKHSREDLAGGIKQLFELCGMAANVRLVTSADEVVADGKNGRVDVFVCDLSLASNSNEPLGLGVISAVKAACPSIFTVAVTAGGADIGEVEAQPKRFDLFVPKVAITGVAFDEKPNYLERLKQQFRYSPVRTFALSSPIHEIPATPPPKRNEILDLIRQVISYRPPLDRSSLIADVELKQLGGGRSQSYVFELVASMGADQRPVLPMILKFSQLSEFYEELRRYNVFVKWTLPHNMRVDLVGSGTSVGWGVTGYSFAHGEKGLRTLRDVLDAGDLEGASTIVERLFEGGRAFWKSIDRDVPYKSLAQRYFERYYRKSAEWFGEDVGKFRSFVRESFADLNTENHQRWELAGQRFPSWIRLLQNGMPDRAPPNRIWSIVHGDLNPNNVIVSRSNDVALIDFRDAGIGHCFEDSITLEVCVRMSWPWNEQPSNESAYLRLIEAEEHLGKMTTLPSDGDPWGLIANIREKSSRMLERPLGQDYYFGLSYACFRMLRLVGLSKDVKRRLVLCGLVAARSCMNEHKV